MQMFSPMDYLRIDLANNLGHDKLTWDERINIVKGIEGNLDDKSIIDNADNKYAYLKAVDAYKETKKGNPTGHIMYLDACSSFLQIMSIISDDPIGAKQSNILNTGKRQDFYTNVTDGMNHKLSSNIQIDRKDVKAAVMPIFYNSIALPKQLFGSNTDEYHALFDVLGELAGGALGLMKTINTLWNKTEDHHSWFLPDGHESYCPVEEVKTKRIEIDELDHKRISFNLKFKTPMRKGRSLPANIIQSVDAYIVREVIYDCWKEGIEVVTIHDAVGTHPVNMGRLRQIFVDTLYKLSTLPLFNNIVKDLGGESYTTTCSFSHDILHSEYALS